MILDTKPISWRNSHAQDDITTPSLQFWKPREAEQIREGIQMQIQSWKSVVGGGKRELTFSSLKVHHPKSIMQNFSILSCASAPPPSQITVDLKSGKTVKFREASKAKKGDNCVFRNFFQHYSDAYRWNWRFERRKEPISVRYILANNSPF